MNYVMNDEVELSKSANSIVNYADFLSRSIVTYIEILADVQTKGINDNLVCAKLYDLSIKLKNYDKTIYDTCSKLSTCVTQDINEIENADNFKFPADLTATISALLAKFL